MSQVLELKFDTANGKTMTLSVNEPKANLTANEVETAMQTIITSDIFHNNGSSVVGINEARIVERIITEFDFTNE
jgi:hypothetical protein